MAETVDPSARGRINTFKWISFERKTELIDVPPLIRVKTTNVHSDEDTALS